MSFVRTLAASRRLVASTQDTLLITSTETQDALVEEQSRIVERTKENLQADIDRREEEFLRWQRGEQQKERKRLLEIAFKLAHMIVERELSTDPSIAVRWLDSLLTTVPSNQITSIAIGPTEGDAAAAAFAPNPCTIDDTLSPGNSIISTSAGEIRSSIHDYLHLLEHVTLSAYEPLLCNGKSQLTSDGAK